MSDPTDPPDGNPDDPARLASLMLADQGSAADLSDAPLMTGLPFAGALGIRMIHSGDGEATLAIPYDAALVGDPESGVIHGGVVTSLLDTCGGVAVLASKHRPLSAATLDLRIDYMRAAQPHQPIFARARCYRETRLITFVSAVAYHAETPDSPIATAVGAFMVEGRKPPVAQGGNADATAGGAKGASAGQGGSGQGGSGPKGSAREGAA
ncbi:MAG: PaaI family thioesterase [Pseudomonadota bacterium]